MARKKKGPLNRSELNRILVAAPTTSAEAIAGTLGRPVAAVERAIARLFPNGVGGAPPTGGETQGGSDPSPVTPPAPAGPPRLVVKGGTASGPLTPDEVIEALHASPHWQQAKAQFSRDELSFYEHEYVQWIQQFDDGVTHSERVQISKVITYSVLQSRNLKEQRVLQDYLEELDKRLTRILKIHPDPDDRPVDVKAKISGIEAEIQSAWKERALKSRELNELEAKHSDLFGSLKATRDQRLEKIDKRIFNIVDVLRRLAEDDRAMDEEGRKAELAKVVAGKKAAEMGQLHRFADGTMDRPLLSADTVGGLEDSATSPQGSELSTNDAGSDAAS